MKNFFTNIIDAITTPFISIAVLLDESRRINEDGSWDKYWVKKNCKAELKALKAEYKQNRKYIKIRWNIDA